MPGFRAPTFDSKAKRATTVDAMCALRRKVLDVAYATAGGQALLDSVHGSKGLALAKMTCVDAANLFRAAAGAKALLNNAQATKDSATTVKPPVAAVHSIAAINEANRKYWEGRTA